MFYYTLIYLFLIGLFPSLVLAQPPKAVPVEAQPVKFDTVIDNVNAVGELLADEQVILRSEIPGRITKITFSEGQKVTQGDPLINLDEAEYRARLAESQSTVNLNKISYARTQDLVKKSLTSQQAFDEAKAQLEVALARQQLYEVQLAKTTLYAPFSGTVGLRNFSAGAYIQAGQDLITLVNTDTLKLDFKIPEKFLAKIRIGQTINLQVDAYPDHSFVGELYTLDPIVDGSTRTLLLRAKIPNPKGLLYPGMFARINLELDRRSQAIIIPEQAIVPKGKDSFVFKILNNKAHLIQVTLGQRRTGDVEITHGLNLGDKIVINGQLKLREGAEVMLQPTQSP